MGMRILRGVAGAVALAWVLALPRHAVADVVNGDSLLVFQRSNGRIENYYAAGDDNLVDGLASAEEYFAGKVVPAPYLLRDGLDEFVPIELKRWNNNAAKAMMARFIDQFFAFQDTATHLIPTGSPNHPVDGVSGQAIEGRANLRYPYYASQLLPWAEDSFTEGKARNLATGTIIHFTPNQGDGFVNNVRVTDGNVISEFTPILAVNWGYALWGMGGLAAQLNAPVYWEWAGPRLEFAWVHRPSPLEQFGDVYNSIGFTLPTTGSQDQKNEVRDWADTDTLYLVLLGYRGARLASDHASMRYLERVARRWYETAWFATLNQCTKKLSHLSGSPLTPARIYTDGKWMHVHALNVLYRISGDPLIIDRIKALWQNFLDHSPQSGLMAETLDNGVASGIAAEQHSMLDALIDSYEATGSSDLLVAAQNLAFAIRNWADRPDARDSTARPFLRLAEKTHGSIGRLEVNFPSKLGRLVIKRSPQNTVIFDQQLPNESAVVYVPPGNYRVETTLGTSGTRAVTLPVTAAGVKVGYDTQTTASFITGTVVMDNNDNGIKDAGDATNQFLGSRAYIDADNDGTMDTGEPNAVVGGSSGTFSIQAANGSYIIRIKLQSGITPGRWTAPLTLGVGGSPGHEITFHHRGLKVDLSAFGYTTKGKISGVVFNDRNGDQSGNNEPRMTDSIVYLDTNDNGARDFGEPYSATDPDGKYALPGLSSAGKLRVVSRTSVPNVTTPTGGFFQLAFTGTGQHITVRNFGVR